MCRRITVFEALPFISTLTNLDSLTAIKTATFEWMGSLKRDTKVSMSILCRSAAVVVVVVAAAVIASYH